MPQAPMGCEAELHKKTDKCGTWAYHSIERLTDIVQFEHKHITNPTLSPTDKFMNVLATCKAALTGILVTTPNQSLKNFKSWWTKLKAGSQPTPYAAKGAVQDTSHPGRGAGEATTSKGAGMAVSSKSTANTSICTTSSHAKERIRVKAEQSKSI
ncbi:hypothetical protein ACHAW6_007279 [Cyclotella cf. meneghiniana]